MLQRWAADMAVLGERDDTAIVIPVRLFASAMEEAKLLEKYPARLPPELVITGFGKLDAKTGEPRPSFFRFAGPSGYVTVSALATERPD